MKPKELYAQLLGVEEEQGLNVYDWTDSSITFVEVKYKGRIYECVNVDHEAGVVEFMTNKGETLLKLAIKAELVPITQ